MAPRGSSDHTSTTTMPPGDTVRRAAGWGARLGLVAFTMWIGTGLALPYGWVVDLAVGAALGLALFGLGSLLLSLVRWLAIDWPRVLGAPVLIATLGALALLIGFVRLPPLAALAAWGAWGGTAVLLALAVVALRSGPGTRPRRRVVTTVAGLGALALAGTIAVLWWHPGDPLPTTPLDPSDVALLDLPDPGARGPLEVATLRYGSGAPGWRAAYGTDAAIRTESLDLADLVELGPVARPARALALGHGLDAVPRNAQVWYPSDAPGPSPLVLIAHGNANLFVPSEEGYAWLGEHLASHGFVVASIDASAFNALPIVGGLRGENDARALLMLAHLDLWRAWMRDGEPAAPPVDLSRVALLGHSRGGEAAAIAATLDRIGRLPNDARAPIAERVGGPYGIRSVIAFAPSDGQFRVGDRPTTREGVDYLVLQGGFDADVTSFVGERQYERAALAEGGFKAAVYVHHANHGQFNDHWGRSDLLPPQGALLRTAAIMDGAQQQRAAAVFTHAFLRASLLGEHAYRALLRDPRAGAAWLPPTSYVTRFDEGVGIELLGDDAGVDPTRGSLPGSSITADALALWRVGDVGFRSGTARDATTLTLGWSREGDAPPPSYRLTLALPLGDLVADPIAATLTLEIGRWDRDLPGGIAAPTGPLDLSLAIVDDAGRVASLPLAATQGIPPRLPSPLARSAALAPAWFRPTTYPLFQRIDVPLAAFLAREPTLDVARVVEIALVFDREPVGAVVVRSLRLEP